MCIDVEMFEFYREKKLYFLFHTTLIFFYVWGTINDELMNYPRTYIHHVFHYMLKNYNQEVIYRVNEERQRKKTK